MSQGIRHAPFLTLFFAMTVTRITEAEASGTVAVIGSSYFQLYLEIVKLKLEKLLFLLFHDILHILKDIHSTV